MDPATQREPRWPFPSGIDGKDDDYLPKAPQDSREACAPNRPSQDPEAQRRIRAQLADKAAVILAHLDNMKAIAQWLADGRHRATVEVYASTAESMMARVQGLLGAQP